MLFKFLKRSKEPGLVASIDVPCSAHTVLGLHPTLIWAPSDVPGSQALEVLPHLCPRFGGCDTAGVDCWVVAQSPQPGQLQAWLLLSQFPQNIVHAHASCFTTVDLATMSSVSALSLLALLDKQLLPFLLLPSPPAPFRHPFDFLPGFLCAVACVFLLKTELRGGP